eukprot:6180193-Pleurochrysis_carterae.AAC.1
MNVYAHAYCGQLPTRQAAPSSKHGQRFYRFLRENSRTGLHDEDNLHAHRCEMKRLKSSSRAKENGKTLWERLDACPTGYHSMDDERCALRDVSLFMIDASAITWRLLRK